MIDIWLYKPPVLFLSIDVNLTSHLNLSMERLSPQTSNKSTSKASRNQSILSIHTGSRLRMSSETQVEATKWPEPKSPWEKMVDCETCKGHHFGVGGAAGMLLARRDNNNTVRPVTHVVLQHRSFSTTAGGTWAMPGGALDEGESPRQAAIREASEEVGLPEDCTDGHDPTIVIWYERALLDHGAWKYTIVIADVRKPFEPEVPQGDTESLEVKWIAIQDVEGLPLHPSFEQAWPELKSILETAPGTSTPE